MNAAAVSALISLEEQEDCFMSQVMLAMPYACGAMHSAVFNRALTFCNNMLHFLFQITICRGSSCCMSAGCSAQGVCAVLLIDVLFYIESLISNKPIGLQGASTTVMNGRTG